MGLFNYNLNIPAAGNNPSDDQPLMQTNTNSVDSWTVIDHYGFNNGEILGGYHKVIHQPANGTFPFQNPSPIASVNQLFSLNYKPNTTGGLFNTQLFSMNGVGDVSQLTGNYANEQGFQWIAGTLLQWGKYSRSSSPGGLWPTIPQDLAFRDRGTTPSTIPFPRNCFCVVATLRGPTSSSDADVIINSVAVDKFVWQWTGSDSASFSGFYWIAIGN